jgi:hypothetical protein
MAKLYQKKREAARNLQRTAPRFVQGLACATLEVVDMPSVAQFSIKPD